MSARLSASGRDAAAPWPSRRYRSRDAAGRLETARRGFEASLVALRKAAFDHIDSQALASVALRRLDRGFRPMEGTA